MIVTINKKTSIWKCFFRIDFLFKIQFLLLRQIFKFFMKQNKIRNTYDKLFDKFGSKET